MPLLPIDRGGADYASAAAILTLDDRPCMDVRVPGWRDAQGEPIIVRIRALGLEDRQWINTVSGIGERRNEMTFILATIHRGIAAPALNWQQAQLLKARNEQTLEMLADTIWELSGLDQRAVDLFVEELAGASLGNGPETGALEPAIDGASELAFPPVGEVQSAGGDPGQAAQPE